MGSGSWSGPDDFVVAVAGCADVLSCAEVAWSDGGIGFRSCEASGDAEVDFVGVYDCYVFVDWDAAV